MAATDAGRDLTEAHREAQRSIGLRTAADLLETWEIIDPVDVSGTTGRWLTAAVAVIEARHAASARLARLYASEFRRAELGAAPPTPPPAVVLDTRRARTSLAITGPTRLASKIAAGAPIDAALSQAAATASASGLRHALSGGRSTITQLAATDPASQGWQRVTAASPCAFCATLAIGGPIRNFRGPTPEPFKAHDSCMCTAEVVYRDSAPPPGVERLQQIYNEATADAQSGELLNAFRRALADAT